MGSIGRAIYLFDKNLFAWIREHLGSEFLDGFSALASNIYFWTPFFMFLLVMLLTHSRRNGALNLLYGLGAIVLPFQAGFILTQIFKQPAPFVVEYVLRNTTLPAYPANPQDLLSPENYSFPDWETAAMTAALVFARVRVRTVGGFFPSGLMLVVLFFSFIRVYAGHAYPYDICGGWLLGIFVAWILVVFAKNMDLVIRPPAPAEDTAKPAVPEEAPQPETEQP